MKVRRKSEIELLRELLEEIFGVCERNIRELELLSGHTAAGIARERLRLWREKKQFAAHYEPVPDPPAREHEQLLADLFELMGRISWGLEKFQKEKLLTEPAWKKLCAIMRAAPSVSEEQPARNTIKTGFETVEQLMASSVTIPAPHRATIALIPHCADSGNACKLFGVEVDGVQMVVKTEYRPSRPGKVSDEYWGTEAEAKAKMESLRGQ